MRASSAHLRGFTLMELILVMLMVCSVLAIAAPSLRGFGAAQRGRDAATHIIAMTNYARTQAITRGHTYRLRIDAQAGQYTLSVVDDDDPRDPAPEVGHTFTLPGGVRIAMDRGGAAGTDHIDFEPTGRCDPATIVLTDDAGDEIRIACPSPTELYAIAAKGAR